MMSMRQTLVICFFIIAPIVMADDRQTNFVSGSQHSTDDQGFDWTVQVPERNWEYVVIHHSATDRGDVESIHREHRSRRDRNGKPWLGIGYHFVIGNGHGMSDGKISPSFRWTQQLHGAHSGSVRHNGQGIGICLIGNFEESKPTAAQRESITRLVRMLSDRYQIPEKKIIGHFQVRATACPGRYFPLREVVEDSVRNRVTRSQPRLPGVSYF